MCNIQRLSAGQNVTEKHRHWWRHDFGLTWILLDLIRIWVDLILRTQPGYGLSPNFFDQIGSSLSRICYDGSTLNLGWSQIWSDFRFMWTQSKNKIGITLCRVSDLTKLASVSQIGIMCTHSKN
jgi:hypothetical protein